MDKKLNILSNKEFESIEYFRVALGRAHPSTVTLLLFPVEVSIEFMRIQNQIPSANFIFNVLCILVVFQSHMQFNSTMEQSEFISYLSSILRKCNSYSQAINTWLLNCSWCHILAVNERVDPPLLQENENTTHE